MNLDLLDEPVGKMIIGNRRLICVPEPELPSMDELVAMAEIDLEAALIAAYVPEADMIAFCDAVQLAEERDAAAANALKAQFE